MSTVPADLYRPKRASIADSSGALTPAPSGWVDVVCLVVLAVVLLTFSFLQSRSRIFWGDEIMGRYVLCSGSWHRFLELWRGGIDSSGFWFYVLAKPWTWVFGAGEVSLRMFSAAGVAVSAVLIWLAARRFYSVPIVALAIAFPFLDLQVLRWQLSNGRCYGVLMAATALVIYLIVRGEDDTHRTPRALFLLATLLAYDVMAGSHILGVLFAGALLGAQVAVDLREHRFRPKLYAAALVGIGAIVSFSLQNLRSTTALGKPVFWTEKPLVRSFWFASDVTESPVRWALIVMFALAFFGLRLRRRREVVYFVLGAFLLVHTGFVLISRLSTSIYVNRYLLPCTFALVLAIAELLMQMRESNGSQSTRYRVVLCALCYVVLFWAPRTFDFGLPWVDYTGQLLADLPAGLPVIDTDVGTFVEVENYHHGRFGRPFLFPLDRDVTVDPTNPGGVSGFHEMDNFAKFGIDAPDLQPTEKILQTYPDFVVVTSVTPTTWFRRRILDSNAYKVDELGTHAYPNGSMRFWKVHRVSGDVALSTGSERD